MHELRKKSWGQYKKSLLDMIIEFFRFAEINKYVKKGYTLLDLGCGYNGELINYYKTKIKKGVGIDISVNKNTDKKISLIEGDLNSKIKLPSDSFDIVTLLAVIEHLESPENVIKEAFRLLKKNGILIITTPNIKWRWLLELLANFGIISRDEIIDHKIYFSQESIVSCLSSQGFMANKIKTSTYPVNKFIDFVVVAVAQK